jgi:hypothetical protein
MNINISINYPDAVNRDINSLKVEFNPPYNFKEDKFVELLAQYGNLSLKKDSAIRINLDLLSTKSIELTQVFNILSVCCN